MLWGKANLVVILLFHSTDVLYLEPWFDLYFELFAGTLTIRCRNVPRAGFQCGVSTKGILHVTYSLSSHLSSVNEDSHRFIGVTHLTGPGNSHFSANRDFYAANEWSLWVEISLSAWCYYLSCWNISEYVDKGRSKLYADRSLPFCYHLRWISKSLCNTTASL